MPQTTNFNISGLNLYTNPFIPIGNAQDGQVIRAVNVDSLPYGAKQKRPGYQTYLGTPDTYPVMSLFSWLKDDGLTFNTYRASGSQLYYSSQGTADWMPCGNGRITVGSQVGYAVLNNTLTISQNGGTTRYSTDGINFTDTALAPAGGYVAQYQNRLFITGTSSTLSYSVTGDPTNWSTTGTSDSSSLTIPGGGLPNGLFKLADRLHIPKGSDNIFRWDGYSLVDLSTNLGPSSPFSIDTVEGNALWLNRLGIITSDGNNYQLISNPIQRFIYNNTGSAVAGTSFDGAPGQIHRYDYFLSVGSMTDDFTNETVPNAIIKYNFQKNEYLNYTFNDFPITWHSYKDISGNQQLIFGNQAGQCFTYGNISLSDNGKPIEAILELLFHYNAPHLQKDWRTLWAFFNPGCEAQIAIATSDTFIKENKNWEIIGDAKSGVVMYRFKTNHRSRFLYFKIIENSTTAPFSFYGIALDAQVVPIP